VGCEVSSVDLSSQVAYFIEPASSMKSVRKKMAGATGLHGAFSGKRGNPAAADALSEDWGADDVESSQLTSEALLEHLLIQVC